MTICSPPIRSFAGRYRFLSNFAVVPVTIDSALAGRSVEYPTVEHAFNAAKTTDPLQRAWVAAAATPGEAKARGRRVALRPRWDEVVRYQAMEVALRAKFTCGHDVTTLLVATGRAELIEGNRWCDNHWGDCECSKPRCRDRGRNILGRMLMVLRAIHQGELDPATPLINVRGDTP
ncbi:NADAR family protein [Sphaerisporangium flaviroseum]|uniref:NADAR family protein n=1 Tax=Sphaerisporangium flaviroseum TaxID=509199 RepID=A0ABP7J294_9ACTN